MTETIGELINDNVSIELLVETKEIIEIGNLNLIVNTSGSISPFPVQKRVVFNPLDNQIEFVLQDIPALPQLIGFYINGLKAIFGVDFLVNSNKLNWISYDLKNEFIIEVYY